MNPDFIIREATVTDAEELSRLNQAFNGSEKRPSAKIVERLKMNHSELVAVAEISGEIVGFGCAQCIYSFCYDVPHGEITELFVEESARRKGIAAALISFLEKSLRDRGVTSMKVLTGRDNSAAIKTYEHYQYVKDDEQLLVKRLGS